MGEINIEEKASLELRGKDKDFVYDYFKTISKFNVYTPEEEKEAFIRLKNGDETAKEEIINHNLKLVVSVAKKYIGTTKSLTFEDLIMEGNIGLIAAVDKFDYELGNKFSTYAIHWIRQSIGRAIMNNDSEIRIPVHMQEKKLAFKRAITLKESSLQKELNYSEMKELLNTLFDNEDTRISMENAWRLKDLVSLNSFVSSDDSDGESEIGDFIEDKANITDMTAISGFRSQDIKNVLEQKLNEREQYIITRRFGLDGLPVSTLEMLGSSLDLTRERVRQIEAKALKKLKHPNVKKMLADYCDYAS